MLLLLLLVFETRKRVGTRRRLGISLGLHISTTSRTNLPGVRDHLGSIGQSEL